MCSSFFCSIIIIFFVYLMVLLPPTSVATSHQGSVKLKLIHVDHPDSPHRRTYDSPEQRDRIWTQRSVSRLVQIYHDLLLAKEESYPSSPYHSRLSPDPAGVFLASLGVGNPINPQLLAMDTGSSFMWVTCLDSKFQAGEYFYYSSSTYSRVRCGDRECEMVPYANTCSFPTDVCEFRLKYFSVSELMEGLVVKDTITFWAHDPEGENITVPGSVFGCGFPTAPLHERFTGTGILGLSNHPVSIASQLGSQFSYCIGSVINSSYDFNSLILGDALLLGNFTPILNISSKVSVSLQSITVGGEVLDIDPSVFERYNSDGGTIVDSGSVKTLLADDAYQVLFDKMKDEMEPISDSFCFSSLEPSQVPVVRFIFENGAYLTLGIDALFDTPTSNLRCFTGIKPTAGTTGIEEMSSYTIIGINAQQHHNIGYDYQAGRMYMSQAQCDTMSI